MGGVGLRCLVEDLLQAQAGQMATDSLTSLFRDGHQKCCLRKVIVLLTPGWHTNLG